MPDQSREASTLVQAWTLWERRKWLAIGVFAVVFSILVAIVLSLPNLYRATATVLVNPNQANGSLAAGNGADNSLDARLASISQQVLSRPRLERLITQFDLYPRLRRDGSLDAAVAQMRHDIHFERTQAELQYGQQSTIAFSLSYQGWKSETVAQITNMLTSFYLQDNAKITQSQASNATADLHAQLQEVTQKLTQQQQQINAYRQRHMGALPEQEAANLSTLNRLNAQLDSNNQSRVRAMGLREDILKQMSTSGAPDLAQLQQKLQQLRTRYSDKYPDVIQVKAQIARLKNLTGKGNSAGGGQGGEALQQRLAQVDQELATLRKENARLQTEIQAYQQRIDNMPLIQQQLQALTQGYAETQDVYASLLKRYEQASLANSTANRSDGLFRVLDSALPPTQPIAPARLQLLVMSLILALVVAAATVFVFEQLDSTVHGLNDLRDLHASTGIPVLVVIPRIVAPADVWRKRLRTGAITVATIVLMVIAVRVGYQLGHANQSLVWRLARHVSTTTST